MTKILQSLFSHYVNLLKCHENAYLPEYQIISGQSKVRIVYLPCGLNCQWSVPLTTISLLFLDNTLQYFFLFSSHFAVSMLINMRQLFTCTEI